MSEEDVRKAVEPLILEYFENSDSMEVLFTLQVKKNQKYILLLTMKFDFTKEIQQNMPQCLFALTLVNLWGKRFKLHN